MGATVSGTGPFPEQPSGACSRAPVDEYGPACIAGERAIPPGDPVGGGTYGSPHSGGSRE